MPNWCEGNIRVRGTYIKIVKFFKENLKALKYDKKGTIQDIPVTVGKDSDYYTVICKPDDDCQDEFWINGTNRQFIDTKEIELIDYSDDEFQEIVICIDGFKGAWNIDLEHFGPMAEKYGVDIKIFGLSEAYNSQNWPNSEEMEPFMKKLFGTTTGTGNVHARI